MKKRKAGILLILIGVGIPLVLFFFQNNGEFVLKERELKVIKRVLTPSELSALFKVIETQKTLDEIWVKRGESEESDLIKFVNEKMLEEIISTAKMYEWSIFTGKANTVQYRTVIGIGLFLVLMGFGLVIFSFFPPSKQPARENISKENIVE